jgi:hypothetical protein
MSRSEPAVIPRASEGQHWYDRDGTPRYEVMAKNGSMRPATLRDARKNGWYPGVTSIIKCAAAPGLELWKRNQSVLSALTLPRKGDETHDALLAAIRSDAEEQARKAREWGTRFHAAIQGHYEGQAPDVEMWECVKGAVEVIDANFPGCMWTPEVPCAHPIGYGTKADLSSANVVLDFKGSDFTRETMGTLKTWDEHHMQLAATREAIRKPNADCAIVYVSRTVPGLCRLIRVDEPDLMQGWAMFKALHSYWCAKSDYYPALWSQKEAA